MLSYNILNILRHILAFAYVCMCVDMDNSHKYTLPRRGKKEIIGWLVLQGECGW